MASRLRRLAARIALALTSLAATLLAAEVALRAAVAAGWPASLRDPARFGDENDDDDFWKLRWIWAGSPPMGPMFRPVLGWTTPATPENPLGQSGRPRPLPAPGSAAPVVVAFGDSYLQFPDDPDALIPARLEAQLSGPPVYNLGMSSYGLDQIALRFRETRGSFPNARMLFGILTGDVDRCVLSFRHGQKPRFVLDASGALALTNVPIVNDQAAYLREHPVEIRSYLFRWAGVKLARRGWSVPGRPDRRPEKEAVAGAILESLVADCRAGGTPFGFVIFHDPFDLEHPTWRTAFLRETLSRLGAPTLDTEEALRAAAKARGELLASFFDPANLHHNRAANEVIAAAIAERWAWLR